MNRRNFMKLCAAAVAGISVGGAVAGPVNIDLGRAAWTGTVGFGPTGPPVTIHFVAVDLATQGFMSLAEATRRLTMEAATFHAEIEQINTKFQRKDT